MKKNTNAIVFAQDKDNTKAVVATRNNKNIYLAYALKTANEPIYEALGGKRVEGVKHFRVEFPTVKNAKAFITQAKCELSENEYTSARKTEPKAKAEKKAKAPTTAKGKKADDLVTVTLADGTQLQVKASALGIATEPKKAPRKSKGDAPTTAPNAKAKKTEPKAEKVAPKKAKGNCPVDFSALAGKGRAANREAAALMRKAGFVDGTTAEYKAVWAEWCKVR